VRRWETGVSLGLVRDNEGSDFSVRGLMGFEYFKLII